MNVNQGIIKLNPLAMSTLMVVGALLLQVAIIKTTSASSYYDPELQDGIPVMSAKSFAPAIKMHYEDHLKDSSAPKRRSADADLEENLDEDDDEDRDDFNKAASSNHDSYENPSFGESRRAAKDGDDIENFFDKHLGPPQEEEGAAGSSEVPITEFSHPNYSGNSNDDEYEAAASSPLSSIFQSIINAHKRPLVITTEDDSDNSKSSTTSKDNSQASSTSLVGSAAKTYNGIGEAGPIAYLAPMIAAPSSLAEEGYEQHQQPQQDTEDDGVREIIITRRPSSFINHLSGYSPSSGRLSQQSSNNHWQNAGYRQQQPYDGAEQSADYSRYPVAASYAYQREQPTNDEQSVTYGLSFGASNDEDQNSDQNDQSSADDGGYSEQPAYGRMRNSASMIRAYQNYQYQPMAGYQPAMAAAAAAAMQYNTRKQQQHYYQQQQQLMQNPYNGARYHKDPSESVPQPVNSMSPGRYSSSHQQQQSFNNAGSQYNSQQQQQLAHPSQMMMRLQASQHNSNSNSNNNNNNNNNMNAAEWVQRQRLLADLNKQIKNNQFYNPANQLSGGDPQSSNNNYALRANDKRVRVVEINRGHLGSKQQGNVRSSSSPSSPSMINDNDVDTYSSFHSEVDPYKSFTTSSRIVSEPLIDNSAQSGSFRDPAASQNNIDHNNQTSSVQTSAPGKESQGIPEGDYNINNNNNNNLLTGPLVNNNNNQAGAASQHPQHSIQHNQHHQEHRQRKQQHLRVRRDDSDDREGLEDGDEDGVWVDDDDDEDNRQQSSDVNETAQEPEDEDGGQAADEVVDRRAVSPPGVVGGPHSFELSPDDLTVYHG